MAYIFDPIRNTFVDDEDVSLGNKLALNDEEFEKLLKIPGVFRASEAPQPPERPEVLDREAINRFIRDNRADGGSIRQNFGVGGMPYKIFGKQIDIPEIPGFQTPKQNKKSVEEGFKKLEKWLKDPTPENWNKIFGKNNAFGFQLRNYLLNRNDLGSVKGMPTANKVFDAINVKNLLTESQINKINELTTGGKGKSLRSIGARTFGGLKFSMDEIIETIKNFQNGEQWLKRNTDPNKKDADGRNIYRKYANAIRTMQSEQKKIGGFPFGDNSEKKLWSNLYRASYRGDRIKIVGEFADGNLPINKDGKIDWKMKNKNGVAAWKRVQFIDTQAPKKTVFKWGGDFKRGDFKKQIDNVFGDGFFKKSTDAYDVQVKTGSRRDYTKVGGGRTIKNDLKIALLRNEALIENPKATEKEINDYINRKARRFNITEVHHPDGVGVNPYKTEPTFRYANRALDKEVMQPLKAGKIDINEAKLRIDRINKNIGPIRVKLDDGYYGNFENTQKSILEAAKKYQEKTGTFKGTAQAIKSKMDNFRSLTSRIPGGAVALTPLDFTLSMASGLPLTESLASAGSYLVKDPYLGKAINIPLAIAQDIQDPDKTFERAQERQGKFKDFLEGITGIDQDEPFASELREKLSNMEAGEQPDIDPFQAAEGGRAGFSDGGATGMSSDEFAKELEYFFLNPDADLPKPTTFRETMNPIEILNDMIDPRNYPYYADRLTKTGIRIGEFGLRVLPAVGKLIGDITTKPAFKIESKTGTGYVQDYDQMPKSRKIKGTGIFSEFLDNLVGTEMTEGISKATGLDDLIKMEEQKMMDRRTTAGPKVLADTATLGMEFTAPIFPGLKLIKAYAKARKLPVDNTTKELLEKEVNDVLDKNGISRRDFMKTAGAGASLVIAKMLGFGDEFMKATKVVRPTVEQTATTGGVPPYFFELVKKIKKSGRTLEPEFDPRVENNMQFENYIMRENTSTGEISIQKTKEGMVDTGYDVLDGTLSEETITYKPGEFIIGKDGKPVRTPDEYEEFTTRPDPYDDGKMKDVEPGLDSIEEIIELMPNQLKRSELEAAGYNVDAFPENIKKLLIDDLQTTN